jgi:macrolide phosphotransferase
LKLVARELTVRVPDWRICTETLIAYPLLPGEPGLTLDPASGAPIWHFDPTSPDYARSLGRLIAAMHRIDLERVRAAGVPVDSPEDVRAKQRANLATVAAEFSIADTLRTRWQSWLDDDSLWPAHTTFTHGELYPAHVLIDRDAQVQSVLDWTTARGGDPAIDFVFQHMMAGPSFAVTVEAYEAEGGRPEPRLAERCAAIALAGPLNYALFALASGQPEHRAAAVAQLNPAQP